MDLPLFRQANNRSGVTAGQPFSPTLFNKWWKKAVASLGVDGTTVYPGTKHSTVTAIGELLSPEEIKRGGTEHTTNAAFERYMLTDVREKLKVRSAIKQLRGENKVITENGQEKIVKFPK